MTIVLLHGHYDDAHLDSVQDRMADLGAPSIRAIYDNSRGVWIALEGCHRLRAAHALVLSPNIIDVGVYDDDGDLDMDAMGESTVNSLTDSDNMPDDPDCTIADAMDRLAYCPTVLEFF